MKKQTAGREKLGELAPKFAELNDDVLFLIFEEKYKQFQRDVFVQNRETIKQLKFFA